MLQTDKISEEEKELLEKYTSLIHLTMNNVGLTTLENFPKLKNLKIVRKNSILTFIITIFQVELNHNKLNGDDIEILVKQCPKLYKIKIEDNNIDSIDKLKCLAQLKELKKINVKGNPFMTKNPKYNNELFEMIKTLESVDSQDKKGNEVESSIYEEGEEEEDDEFIEDDEYDDDEGEEYNDDDEDDEDDDEDDDDDDEEEKPKKRQKK